MGTSAGSSAQQAMDLLVAAPISAACRLGNRHVREAVGHVKTGWVRRGAGGAMWRCCDEAAAVLLCQGTPSSPQPQALAGGLGITPVPGVQGLPAARPRCPAQRRAVRLGPSSAGDGAPVTGRWKQNAVPESCHVTRPPWLGAAAIQAEEGCCSVGRSGSEPLSATDAAPRAQGAEGP